MKLCPRLPTRILLRSLIPYLHEKENHRKVFCEFIHPDSKAALWFLTQRVALALREFDKNYLNISAQELAIVDMWTLLEAIAYHNVEVNQTFLERVDKIILERTANSGDLDRLMRLKEETQKEKGSYFILIISRGEMTKRKRRIK